MKTQVQDLLTMQKTLIHQMEAFTMDQEEGEEEPIVGEAIINGKPSSLPCPMESRSVQDFVFLVGHTQEKKASKSVNTEKRVTK